MKKTIKYGDGWSLPHLKNIRQFYLTYSKRLNTVYPIDPTKAIQRVANSPESAYSVDPIQFEIPNKFTLSWSHYLVLMRIKKEEERQFYEIECQKQDWSVRQLKREYGASLYERPQGFQCLCYIIRIVHSRQSAASGKSERVDCRV